MADYTRATGGTGTMMIRDTGSVVEFWLMAGSSTFMNELPWGYIANGAAPWYEFRFASGGAWQRLGSVTISSDQNVTFRLGATGTGGLGGPTDFTVFIDRSSAPSAPKPPVLTVRGSTVIELDLGADGANNGAGIDSRQYSGSSSSGGVGAGARNAVNNYQWTGLQPGTKYYFWERTHNAKGYSPWSAVASATTWNVPAAPSAVAVTSATDTTLGVKFTDGANNGQTIDQRQVGYSLTATGVITWVDVASTGGTITGLTPRTTYHLWGRTHNSVGWSAAGPRSQTTTLGPPDAPSAPVISEVAQTSVRAVFTDNGDGGAAITGHQLGWSTDGAAPVSANVISSDLDQVLTGLPAGTLVYFFARSQNIYGWGEWSAAQSARTVAGGWVYDPVGKIWRRAIPWVNVNGVWRVGKPWGKIAGVWKGTTS